MNLKKKRKKKNHPKISLNSTLELPLILVIANNFLNQIGFVDFINRSVTWKNKLVQVTTMSTPGGHAMMLVELITPFLGKEDEH